MLSKTLKAALALLCVSGAAGFTSVPQSTQQFSSSALHMKNEDGMKKAAASFLAGALILSNVAGVEPALAVLDNNVPDFGSSQVVAARSGGRAGGRAAPRASSSYRSAPSSYRSAPSSRSTTVINRTYVTPAPMYSAPSVYVAPPLYSPGLGEYTLISRIRVDCSLHIVKEVVFTKSHKVNVLDNLGKNKHTFLHLIYPNKNLCIFLFPSDLF